MKTFEEFRFKVKHSAISSSAVVKMKPVLDLKKDDYFYRIIFDKQGNANEITLCKVDGLDGMTVNYVCFSAKQDRLIFTYFMKNANFRKVDDYTYTFTMFFDFPDTITTDENVAKDYSEKYNIEINTDVK